MNRGLKVQITRENGAYMARVAGYVDWAATPKQAALRVAEKAARDLRGEWRVTGVELSARVMLEGVAT